MRHGAAPYLLALAFFPAPFASGADCNGNGIADIEEVRSGALPDCNGNGVPDGCDILPVNYGLVSAGSFFAGQNPAEVLVDDLDGDGDVDLATASNEGNDQVTVLWNDGQGRFTEPAYWPLGQASEFLVAPDLNMDGLKDLVVGGNLGIAVLFQNQEREFLFRAPVLTLETRLHGLVGGDLDSDSDIDLAVIELFGARVLRNEGGGSFSPLDAMPIGSGPVRILAVALDGDEDLDLATCNITGSDVGNVSIFINRGDGSFEIPRNYATVRDPVTVVTGDLDGDGDADLASANQDAIEILLGDGQGRFTPSTQLTSETLLWRLASADLDGDGSLDLAAAGGQRVVPAGVSVFLNQGRAEFARLVDFETGSPHDIESGDIDGDGVLELIVVDGELGAITILRQSEVHYSTDCNSNLLPDDCELARNDCNANEIPDECDLLSGSAPDCNHNGVLDECDIPGSGFGFEWSFLALRSFASLLSSNDLDDDGREDLYAVAEPGDLAVYWNGGSEGFLPEVRFPAGLMASDSATGDLDNDGDRDIVLADAAETQGLRILENRGSRTFSAGKKLPLASPQLVSTADLDGDLDLDLHATTLDGSLVVHENRGGGVFGDRAQIAGGISGNILEVSDLDGDGQSDLAVVTADQRSMLLFWNVGALLFQGPTVIELGFPVGVAAITDADGDGNEDIILSAQELLLFRNLRGRVFARQQLSPDPIRGVRTIVPGDLDGDGDEDLAVVSGRQLAGLLNRGGGVFDVPVLVAWLVNVSTPPVGGDWNGDGDMDLALADQTQMVIFENLSRPPFSRDVDLNGVPDECQQRPFHRGDANGDGVVNLTDPVFTLRHLFQGERAPSCLEAADTNNDARLEITDPIATLDFLFRSGPPPAPPGPPPADCGLDTDASGSAGDIGCGAYLGC